MLSQLILDITNNFFFIYKDCLFLDETTGENLHSAVLHYIPWFFG